MDGTDDATGPPDPLVTSASESARRGRVAVSAEDLAWEGPARRAAPGGDVPVLQVEGFEGPLDWLLEQARAGRVDPAFARGGVEAPPAKAERAADLPALLRTYARLMGPPPQAETYDVYRPRLHPLWRVPDALACIGRLLPELLGAAAPDGASL